MGYKFERPNKDNVELGDLLIYEGKLLPIKRFGDDFIFGGRELAMRMSAYEFAIVLKKDGRYLVGENVSTNSQKLYEFDSD